MRRLLFIVFLLLFSFGNIHGQTMLALVKDKHWVFIDQSGNVIIDSLGMNPHHFSDGVLRVKSEFGAYGYWDQNGKWLIKLQYERAEDFSEGLAAVRVRGVWGFIDKQNKMQIPLQFDDTRNFSNGMAAVRLGKYWGFINKNGELIKSDFEVVRDFTEYGAAVKTREGKWGIIKANGEWLIQPSLKVEYLGAYDGGLLRAKSGGFNTEISWGYINATGKVVVPFNLTNAEDYHDGLARVRAEGKWGFVDSTGNFVIKMIYQDAEDFSEGVACVKINNKWGLLDKSGNWVIEPKYDRLISCKNGLIGAKETSKFGFIDLKGNWIINPKFSAVKGFEKID